MDTYGLIGFPLGHSFSRQFFTGKFAEEGIDAQYLNFELPSIDLFPQILEQHPETRGLNVTIPYKQAVMPYLDEISPEAQAIGAVNVIQVRKKENDTYWLKGFNSDIIGFRESLRPLLRPHHRKALILGTGGASKAVRVGLEQMGIEWLYVSRTPHDGSIGYADIRPATLREFSILVNCTPVGMFPHTDECPALPYQALDSRNLLFDLVYNPVETRFLQRGAEQSSVTKNGLEMLYLQAIASWEFWQG